MSFAEIQKLKELLKTLQGSGEATTRVRMEVGRAIEQLQKERSVARTMADSGVSQPLGLLESSFEKSSLLGERWKPPWDPTWNSLPTGIEWAEQEILNPRAFDVNLNSYSPLGVQRRLTDREINKIVTSDLPQETKEIVIKKLEYRRNILDNAEREISGYTTTTEMERWLAGKRDNIDSNIQKIIGLKQSGTSIWSQKELDDMVRNQLVERDQIEKSISRMKEGLPLDPITSKKLESIDDSIYKMGATQWEEKKGIPLGWLNTNKAYETPTAIEELSGSFFTGNQIPGTSGTDLLSFKDPEKVLNKATIFTQKQWRDKEAAQQEIEFINNYLLDPEMAAEYAKTAPFSFFKYWSQKGGTLGLKEHMQSLKIAARADDVEPEAAKWGALTTVKGVKTKDFTFASLRGQVIELWEPTSPRISQVGLLKDSSGESIKFTVWNNQQQNIPKVEKGKNYYFGNVASQEWQGRWNLNVNQFSAIEEIKPMLFNTAPPLMIPGSKVELRDYSKPYSIDAKKGTITYTTKSGKVVEMPIQQAGKKDLVNVQLGDEPGDLAAFLPFAGLPFLMGNVKGGTAQIDSQQSMGMNTHPMIQESLTETYNDLGELGSIWGKKIEEVYPRYKERDAEYRREMAEGTMSSYRKYLPLDFGLTILDVLGAGLYPLVYPQQALSGGAMRKTWMEGIREEVSPSKALGIEGTWTGLGADIVLDPLNLAAGAGLVGKFSKADSLWDAARMLKIEIPEFLKNDEAVLGRTTDSWPYKKTVGQMDALRLNQKEMSTRQQVFLTTQIRAEAQNKGKSAEYFEKLYGDEYEKIKSDYITAENITPEEFENIAREYPDFADKMTTWMYVEYGQRTKAPTTATQKIATDQANKEIPQSYSQYKEEQLKKALQYRQDWTTWDFFNFEAQKLEQGIEPAKTTAEHEAIIEKRKAKISEQVKIFLEENPEPVQYPEIPIVNADPSPKLHPWLKTIANDEEHKAIIEKRKAKIREATQEAISIDEVENPIPVPEQKTPVVWKEPRIRELPAPKPEPFINWNNVAKKGIKTAAIGITASVLFGLPEEEREYNKPQAREPLEPSWDKGFWGSFGDAATYDNYLEGAAMLNAKQSEKVYTAEDRITPSMIMGIQNRDTSLFSIRGFVGTWFVDMPVAPTSYIKAPKIVGEGLLGIKDYAGSKMGQIGDELLEQTTKIKNKYSPDLWGQPGGYSSFLKNIYDPALSGWKYMNTLARGAYFLTNLKMGLYTNFIGGVEAKDYYQGTKLLLGFDKNKVINKDTGKEGWQVLEEIKAAKGITGISGAMDVQPVKNTFLNIPIKLAQAEESFLRTPIYTKAIREGKTPQEALELVYKYQGNYVDYSDYEKEIAKRLVPFYASQRFAQPLMFETILTNPGKIFQIEKVEQAATEEKPIPAWTGGSFNWWQPDNPNIILSTRTPLSDTVDLINDPLKYGINSLIPGAKTPIELYTGKNYYTNRSFDPDQPIWHPGNNAWANLALGSQGYVAGNVDNIIQGKNVEKSKLGLVGVNTGAINTAINADTDRDLYRRYTGRQNDFSYEQRLALMQRDNWASAQSGISGKFEQLQGGHFYPAALGGPPLPWNYITQTREENSEWLSAQNFIENLPERELQQEEAWGRVEQEYSTGVEEINARTLDNSGRTENEAQKEKKRYDLRKSENIKIYNRQLNTVRSAIQSAEKDLRGEKKKVEDARAKGYSDPASEAQIKVIEAVLTEYRALYEKVSGLRDAEQGKEFELPVQGTDLSRFQPMNIGGYDKYAVRYGKGPELVKSDDIEKLVNLKKIAAYYAATKSYGPVAGFRPGTPEEVKNRILFTRDPRYEELAQIANPLISGAGWEGISGKNYIGPRNISEIRAVVEGSVSEPDPGIGVGEPPAWYSDQQVSQEPGQTAEFDYNDPEFREVVREIVQETLSEGIVTD